MRTRTVLSLASVLAILICTPGIAAEKKKSPPPKSPPAKTECPTASSGGVTTNKAKTADKAFNAMSCYIRG